ncbi:MAG: dTDP-4-dehydrorhamnose reductase [Deltaproteobacteria bacterium]|nr:dTDP-4-dehydrorhamnose reductase [Deltaproteobacteria bacterium]
MKILLLGRTGMLGSDCYRVLSRSNEIIAPDRKELDIVSWDKVIEMLQNFSPDIILNCAGFTDVDACEKEDFRLRKVNVEGPRNLAQGAARFNCKFIHISSDYVFSGQKTIPQPYFEDDTMDPLSAYGKSKVESEVGVRENAPDYIIVRTGWLYSHQGKNFIKSILENAFTKKRKALKIVEDQVGSPTWTYRLAIQIRTLIKANAIGTYHATSEGYCTRYDFARYIFDKLKIKINLTPCRMKDYRQVANRPSNCILENRLLKKQAINVMPDWQQDVNIFLDRFGKEMVKNAKSAKRK